MRDWSKYTAETVRLSKEGGFRIIIEFSKDFEALLGRKINCVNCKHDFKRDFNNFLKQRTMTNSNKCEYKLKPKYDGISIGIGGPIIRNADLTDEIAVMAIAKHPKGVYLFEKLPEGEITTKEKKEIRQVAEKSEKDSTVKVSKKSNRKAKAKIKADATNKVVKEVKATEND